MSSSSDSGCEGAVPVESKQSAWRSIWQNNKGAFLILMAEVFGTSMDAIVRLLETEAGDGHGMHPFQVCFPPTLRTRSRGGFVLDSLTDGLHRFCLRE
jgi:hypothetical protein